MAREQIDHNFRLIQILCKIITDILKTEDISEENKNKYINSLGDIYKSKDTPTEKINSIVDKDFEETQKYIQEVKRDFIGHPEIAFGRYGLGAGTKKFMKNKSKKSKK